MDNIYNINWSINNDISNGFSYDSDDDNVSINNKKRKRDNYSDESDIKSVQKKKDKNVSAQ